MDQYDLFDTFKPLGETISPSPVQDAIKEEKLTIRKLTGTDIDRKVSPHKIKEEEIHDISFYLKVLREAPGLWDMRTWKEYKNSDHLSKFLDYIYTTGLADLNSCRSVYALGMLKEMSANREDIIKAMMENNSYSYKKRIALCWRDKYLCPWYKVFKNYSDCPCHKCNEKKDPKRDEVFLNAKLKWEKEHNETLNFLIP